MARKFADFLAHESEETPAPELPSDELLVVAAPGALPQDYTAQRQFAFTAALLYWHSQQQP